MAKEEKKQRTIWDYIRWIILVFLIFYFLFGGFDNSDRIDDLEYEIEDLHSQIECLNDYIYYLNIYIDNPSSGHPYFDC